MELWTASLARTFSPPKISAREGENIERLSKMALKIRVMKLSL
jgi:hypothetical protein